MAKKDAKRAPIEDSPTPAKGQSNGQSNSQTNGQAAAATSEGFNANSFVDGTREELTKVIWPTRQQLISESAAVILMVGLSATLISLVDKLFGWASMKVF